jgi:hypothetical protein
MFAPIDHTPSSAVDAIPAPTSASVASPLLPATPLSNTPALNLPSLRPTITGRSLLDELNLGDVQGLVSNALDVLAPHGTPTKTTTLPAPSSTLLAARSPNDDDLFGGSDGLIDALDYSATIATEPAAAALLTATASYTVPAASKAARVLEQDDDLIGGFDAMVHAWTTTSVASAITSSIWAAAREIDDGLIGDYGSLTDIDPLAPLATPFTTATAADSPAGMTIASDALDTSSASTNEPQTATAPVAPFVSTTPLVAMSETPSASTAGIVSTATATSSALLPCMAVILELQTSAAIATATPFDLAQTYALASELVTPL